MPFHFATVYLCAHYNANAGKVYVLCIDAHFLPPTFAPNGIVLEIMSQSRRITTIFSKLIAAVLQTQSQTQTQTNTQTHTQTHIFQHKQANRNCAHFLFGSVSSIFLFVCVCPNGLACDRHYSLRLIRL